MAPVQSESRLSSLGIKILAVLEDGEWHDQEDVIEQAMYIIPPGEAFRHGQSLSNAVIDHREMDEVIASGRRGKTVAVINNLMANNRVERVGEKGRSKPKQLRITRPVTQVYVVRDGNDDLNVYYQTRPEFVVHVIDAWAKSEDPERDAQAIKEIFETLPARMPGKQEVEAVCRKLMNRLNVDAALKRLTTTYAIDQDQNQNNQTDWGASE